MMVMNPLSGLFLAGSCVAAIAAVGSIFELSSGAPELGSSLTTAILSASIPLAALCFWAAVRTARSSDS
jgi:hypothetical protein